jgi:hypothetical protein
MMIYELKKGRKYMIPGSENIFVFTGVFSMSKDCFTRQDGTKHAGMEFIEFHNGTPYLNLVEVKK